MGTLKLTATKTPNTLLRPIATPPIIEMVRALNQEVKKQPLQKSTCVLTLKKRPTITICGTRKVP